MKEGTPVRVARFVAAAAIVAAFTLIAAWTVRLALADHKFRQETLPGTRGAILLEPDSAAYYVRLSDMLQESTPAGSALALERAIALNPRDSQSRIELGLRAEMAGDLAGAESSLLRAASVDSQYYPRWSLASYYFRHGNSAKFWLWARKATEIAYGDLTPLFTLCWKISSDGPFIERSLDIRKADIEANYLTYLTSQKRVEPMTQAATRLLAWNREADTPVLLAACDRLIADECADQAIQIWNKLAELHRIHYGVLAPSLGTSLTDGDFTISPMSRGFDWQLPSAAGVTALLDERPASLRISFSGRQLENCDVLTQVLPVMESSNYELWFLYRTAGIASETGLEWRITNLNESQILAQGESLASESEKEGKLPFRTSAGGRLVRLTLTYQRALGTARIEGLIVLRKLRLMQSPPPSHDSRHRATRVAISDPALPG